MIKGYEDLEIYKEGYTLAIAAYKLTERYPEHVRYEMGRQIRNACVSVPMNIAEGYGKSESELEFKRYLRMAMGSCNELAVLFDLSCDLGYISEPERSEMKQRYNVLGKRINATIQKWKKPNRTKTPT